MSVPPVVPPVVAAVVGTSLAADTAAAGTVAAGAVAAGAVAAGAALKKVIRTVLYTGVVVACTWEACAHYKGDKGALQKESVRAAQGAVRLLSDAVDRAKAGGKKW